jgi:hypothetical protein
VSESDDLVAMLDGFHITDRGLIRSRDRARNGADPAAAATLKKEMHRYFSAVEREAAAQLTSIDAKLDDLYQRQYNLHAERAVAERRLANARALLGRIAEADRELTG